MTTKAIEAQVAREHAGVDTQVLLGELVERHDPRETATLGTAYAAVAEGRYEDALDLIGALILMDQRENRAHIDARDSARAMTGRLSGVGVVRRKGAA